MSSSSRDVAPVRDVRGPCGPVRFRRDATATVIDVEDGITTLLGWLPEEMVGRPSSSLIHPEDQAFAISAWFDMISGAETGSAWRGRYQAFDGTWTWVEVVNENRLDDPDEPCVVTVMTRIAEEQVSSEESLRAREQLLSRLSEALPVGVFQIDSWRRITFANARLQTIAGVPDVATTRGLFAAVAEADRAPLEDAFARTLLDEQVEDVELTIRRSEAEGSDVVAVLSLRPLTDDSGRVTGAIGCLSDVTDQVRMRRQLQRRATVDDLTSCLNRAATLDVLAEALAHHGDAEGTAVVFVDLDEFKAVNDAYGHVVGDRLLQVAADRLRGSVRPGDEVGRIGGDEFLVVCRDVHDAAHALGLAGRLARSITGDVRLGERTVPIRGSVGVAWTDQLVDPDSLVARADRAMYENKSGKQDAATLATT